MKNLQAVELLTVVYLPLLFGFCPSTVVKIDLSSIVHHDEGYNLIEAFWKGYTAKTVPKKRMYVPWADFLDVKFLSEHYFKLVLNTKSWPVINITGNAFAKEMRSWKLCDTELGIKLPKY